MSVWLQETMATFGVSERQQLAELMGVHASMITYMERRGVTRKGLRAMLDAAERAGVTLPESVWDSFTQRPARNGSATSAVA